MSTAIHPCRLCPLREGCNLREAFRLSAAGCGAVSITYRCPILTKEIRVGRRVVVNAPYISTYHDYNSDGEVRIGNLAVSATITAVRANHSFACTVDAGALGSDEDGYAPSVKDPNALRFRRLQKHHRIVRFLDEPDEHLCEMCGSRIRNGQCDRKQGLSTDCTDTAHEIARFV